MPRSASQKLRWLKIGVLATLMALIVVALIAVVARRSLPPLTDESLTQAEARWQNVGVHSYDIQVEVRGAQPAVYLVKVRDGEPTSASRNDIPLTQRRTWETWTVPGMFDTLASDVASLVAQNNLVVRCEFAENGLPERYERIEMGTGQQVSWEVKRFEVTR